MRKLSICSVEASINGCNPPVERAQSYPHNITHKLTYTHIETGVPSRSFRSSELNMQRNWDSEEGDHYVHSDRPSVEEKEM